MEDSIHVTYHKNWNRRQLDPQVKFYMHADRISPPLSCESELSKKNHRLRAHMSGKLVQRHFNFPFPDRGSRETACADVSPDHVSRLVSPVWTVACAFRAWVSQGNAGSSRSIRRLPAADGSSRLITRGGRGSHFEAFLSPRERNLQWFFTGTKKFGVAKIYIQPEWSHIHIPGPWSLSLEVKKNWDVWNNGWRKYKER